MTGKERAQLRAQANGMETLFQIGKSGLTPTLEKQVDDALRARELIKLRVLETAPVSVREAADTLAAATQADVIQVIGTKLVLYRENTELKENAGKKEKAKKKVKPIRASKKDAKASYGKASYGAGRGRASGFAGRNNGQSKTRRFGRDF